MKEDDEEGEAADVQIYPAKSAAGLTLCLLPLPVLDCGLRAVMVPCC